MDEPEAASGVAAWLSFPARLPDQYSCPADRGHYHSAEEQVGHERGSMGREGDPAGLLCQFTPVEVSTGPAAASRSVCVVGVSRHERTLLPREGQHDPPGFDQPVRGLVTAACAATAAAARTDSVNKPGCGPEKVVLMEADGLCFPLSASLC